jgi:hypothetical protein
MEFTVIILFKGTTVTLAGLCRVDSLLIEFLRFGTTDLNGDGASLGCLSRKATVSWRSRNNDRLPWNTTFDLGVQHQITIAGNNKFEIRADIFKF